MKTALCVGINEYADLPESTLAGCVNDAGDFSEALVVKGFNTSILTDGFALREVILDTLRRKTSDLRKGDTLVFTNSSHGTWSVDKDGDEADHRDEAICPFDVKDAGPITDDELYEIFSQKAFGSKVIFFSDSCHSGTLARFAPALTRGTDTKPARIKFMPPEVWLSDARRIELAVRAIRSPLRAKARMGALVMAGCRDDEYSFDAFIDGRPCGAFTYAALKALKGLDAAPRSSSSSSSSGVGGPTYSDWHSAIRKILPSVDFPQTPQIDGTVTQKRWALLQ